MATGRLQRWCSGIIAAFSLCLQCGVLAEDTIVTLGPSTGTQISNCQYISTNGSSIDLTRVGTKGSASWKYQPTGTPTSDPGLYSYNPCYPFNQGNCKDAAVCRSDNQRENDVTIGLADEATFVYDETQGIPVIQYVAPAEIGGEAVITLVTLHCQAPNLQDSLEIVGNTTANIYIMALRSHCCCFGGCSSDITPSSKKLSFGSILCILFVCVATVYFIGGIIYMKCFRGAKGVEVIPNFSFWSDFPNLVMEGVMFVFTCGKGPARSTYEDI